MVGQITQITYQSEEELKSIETMEFIVLILVIISLIISLASFTVEPMIGIELITSVQFLYFMLSTLSTIPIELVPIAKYLKLSNGCSKIE